MRCGLQSADSTLYVRQLIGVWATRTTSRLLLLHLLCCWKGLQRIFVSSAHLSGDDRISKDCYSQVRSTLFAPTVASPRFLLDLTVENMDGHADLRRVEKAQFKC